VVRDDFRRGMANPVNSCWFRACFGPSGRLASARGSADLPGSSRDATVIFRTRVARDAEAATSGALATARRCRSKSGSGRSQGRPEYVRPRGPELPDQQIFEHFAGRPLEPAERVLAATVHKMTSAQVVLAKTFALKDIAVAFMYLSRVAPDETIEQRHYVAKHLAGLV